MKQQEKLQQTVSFLKSKLETPPKVAIILGSGLGDFAKSVQGLAPSQVFSYEEIPYFKKTQVEGHKGAAVFGSIEKMPIAILQGRVHVYEGHDLQEVVFPIRVLRLLGAEYFIFTNAAGAINLSFTPGNLVCLEDHLNLSGVNPLVGPNLDYLGPRFPDMTYAYSPRLREILKAAAQKKGITLQSGVYAGVLGPNYETPAEIRMLRHLGADVVGMSTVPEVIAANHFGAECLGISCVSNMGAGILKQKLHHEEIKEKMGQVVQDLSALLFEAIANFPTA